MANTSVNAKGVYNATSPTETDTQPDFLQLDSRGNLKVAVVSTNSTTATTVDTPTADALVSANHNALDVLAFMMGYNGTTWDRLQVDSAKNLVVNLRTGGGTTQAEVLTSIVDGESSNAHNLVAASIKQAIYNGATWDRLRTSAKFISLASTAVGSEATVWTPTSGKKFRLMGFMVAASTAISILLKDNTSGTTIFQIPTLLAGTPVHVTFGNGILSAAANNVLTATGSGTGNLVGTFFGTEE